jgi:hypothetical protein
MRPIARLGRVLKALTLPLAATLMAAALLAAALPPSITIRREVPAAASNPVPASPKPAAPTTPFSRLARA